MTELFSSAFCLSVCFCNEKTGPYMLSVFELTKHSPKQQSSRTHHATNDYIDDAQLATLPSIWLICRGVFRKVSVDIICSLQIQHSILLYRTIQMSWTCSPFLKRINRDFQTCMKLVQISIKYQRQDQRRKWSIFKCMMPVTIHFSGKGCLEPCHIGSKLVCAVLSLLLSSVRYVVLAFTTV